MRSAILTAAALLGLSSPAAAYFFTGNDIHSYCDEDSGKYDLPFCSGIVAGIYDGLQFMGVESKERVYCTPEDVTLAQMRDVFRNHIRDHPETRHESGPWIFLDALAAAWPCPPL